MHGEKMVQIFYSMDYNEVLPTEAEISLFQLHARMFTLSDAYDICELRHVAADKSSAQCLTAWRPSDSFSSIHDVYVAAPPSAPRLRKIVCTAIRKKPPALINDKAVAKQSIVLRVVRNKVRRPFKLGVNIAKKARRSTVRSLSHSLSKLQ